MKYKIIKQTTGYNCGAVALYNACVALNIKPLPLSKISKLCKTDSRGVYYRDIIRLLKNKQFPIKSVRCKSAINALVKLQDAGKHRVLIFGYELKHQAHYCLITYSDKKYLVHNWAKDSIMELHSFKKFKLTSVLDYVWILPHLVSPLTCFHLVESRIK